MLALHDQDTVFYGKTCFDLVLEIAGEIPEAETGEMASDYSPLIVLHINAFKGGLIVAAHHQTLPSIRGIHHIRGFVPPVARINVGLPFGKGNSTSLYPVAYSRSL